MQSDRVDRLCREIRRITKMTELKADKLEQLGESVEIVIHQVSADLERVTTSMDDDLFSPLQDALELINTSLIDDAGDRAADFAEGAREVARELNRIHLKLERLRTGSLRKLSAVIDYLEGCDSDSLNESGIYKADVKMLKEAKAGAWGVYDLIADNDNKRKAVKK